LKNFKTIRSKNEKQFRDKYKLKSDDIVIQHHWPLAPIKYHELFFDAIENITKNISKKVKAIIVVMVKRAVS